MNLLALFVAQLAPNRELYNLRMSYVRATNNPPPQEDEASTGDKSVASTESEATDPETAEN